MVRVRGCQDVVAWLEATVRSRDLVAGGVFPEAIGRARWWWSPPPYRVARGCRGSRLVLLDLAVWEGCVAMRPGARERRERGSGNQREEPEQDRSLMTFQKG